MISIIYFRNDIEANDFIDFICCNKDVKEKTYTKGYAKHSFIHITREFLEKSGVDVKLIDDDLLLDSVKSLFKNLRNFDLLKFNNSKKDVRELAAKGFCDKFSESQKKLRDNVFSAIEHYFKEIVKGDKTKKYTNGNGKKESLEDRMDFVEQRF